MAYSRVLFSSHQWISGDYSNALDAAAAAMKAKRDYEMFGDIWLIDIAESPESAVSMDQLREAAIIRQADTPARATNRHLASSDMSGP